MAQTLGSITEPEPALRQSRATSMLLIGAIGSVLQCIRPLQQAIWISLALGEAAISTCVCKITECHSDSAASTVFDYRRVAVPRCMGCAECEAFSRHAKDGVCSASERWYSGACRAVDRTE